MNRGSLPHTTTDKPAAAAVPEHNVLPESAESWDSNALRKSEEFRVVFKTPGNYTYSCSLHEANGMIGHIIVR